MKELRQIVGLRSLIEELLTPWTEERTERKQAVSRVQSSGPSSGDRHHSKNLRRGIRTSVEEMGGLFLQLSENRGGFTVQAIDRLSDCTVGGKKGCKE